MTSFLRPRYVPQIEGNRLRLHVERKVFGGRPGKELGRSWLTLCPGSVAGDHDEEATVDLPIEQHAALVEACAAFNRIMDAHELGQAAKPQRVAAAGLPLQRVSTGFIGKRMRPAAMPHLDQ